MGTPQLVLDLAGDDAPVEGFHEIGRYGSVTVERDWKLNRQKFGGLGAAYRTIGGYWDRCESVWEKDTSEPFTVACGLAEAKVRAAAEKMAAMPKRVQVLADDYMGEIPAAAVTEVVGSLIKQAVEAGCIQEERFSGDLYYCVVDPWA